MVCDGRHPVAMIPPVIAGPNALDVAARAQVDRQLGRFLAASRPAPLASIELLNAIRAPLRSLACLEREPAAP